MEYGMSRIGKIARKVLKKWIVKMPVGVKKVTPETRWKEDLNVDRLELFDLVMSLEDEFGVRISDREADEMKTFGDTLRCIEWHLEAKESRSCSGEEKYPLARRFQWGPSA